MEKPRLMAEIAFRGDYGMAARGQAVVWVMACLLAPSAALAQCSLKDLNWLTGAWHVRIKSREIQEHWAAAPSGQLMGLSWNTNFSGGDNVVAVQTIFQRGKDLLLQQRFFDSELSHARDPLDAPISFTASSCHSGFVEFRGAQKWADWRVEYKRVGDTLAVEGIAGHNNGLGHFQEMFAKE
jgi:hypothetical protein